MRVTRLVACGALLAMTAPSATRAALAQAPEAGLASLRGLAGVGVIVERVIDDGGLYGLHRTGVRADATYVLEQAGIRVLSMTEYLDVDASPYLHIDVDLTPTPVADIYAYEIAVELRQDVRSAVLSDTVLYEAATWRAERVLGSIDAGGLRSLRDRVERVVERFAEDFHAANR